MPTAADLKAVLVGRVALLLGALGLAVTASLLEGVAAKLLTVVAVGPLLAAASSRLACRLGRILKPSAEARPEDASRR